jgi:hypothetical protein
VEGQTQCGLSQDAPAALARPYLLQRHDKLLVFPALVVQLLRHAVAPLHDVARVDPRDLGRAEEDDGDVALALVGDAAEVGAGKLLGEDLGLRAA